MRPEDSFLEQPIRSLQTMLRVIAQEDQRIPAIIPDGIYGPTTTQTVSAFQRVNGLPVTGATDQVTWEAIVANYDKAIIRVGKAENIEIIMNPGRIIRQNESSPYVFLLQSMLTQLSFDHPTILEPEHTGILDTTTSEALMGFQKLAGLPETGELDKITWKHLVKQFTLNAHHHETQINRKAGIANVNYPT